MIDLVLQAASRADLDAFLAERGWAAADVVVTEVEIGGEAHFAVRVTGASASAESAGREQVDPTTGAPLPLLDRLAVGASFRGGGIIVDGDRTNRALPPPERGPRRGEITLIDPRAAAQLHVWQ